MHQADNMRAKACYLKAAQRYVGEPQTLAFYIVGQKFASGGKSDVALDLVNRAAIEGLTAEGMSA